MPNGLRRLGAILQDCWPCFDFIKIQRIIENSGFQVEYFFCHMCKISELLLFDNPSCKGNIHMCHYYPCTSLLMRAASAMLVACVFYMVGIGVPAVSCSTVICISIV